MSQGQPIYILPESAMRTKGKDAQRNNILAAKTVADTIRSTLGPKGMDKMLVDSLGEVVVTNDGATILSEIEIEHPGAKMIVEIAKTQDSEIGDGTTTAVVLAGELLKNAEELLDRNIHPTLIVKGYRMAQEEAQKIIHELSKKIDITNKEILKNISMTAMTGKGAEGHKEDLAQIIVDAVSLVANKTRVDKDDIKIEKKVGSGSETSELIKGVLLDKERVHNDMPEKVENAKVLLLDAPIEIKGTEIDAKIQINDPMQIQGFLDQEEKILQEKVSLIKKLGANVVICQKGIDDVAQYYLAKHGIYAIRRVKKSDMEKLAKATNAKILSNLKEADSSDLGYAGIVEEVMVADEAMTVVKDTKNPKAVTILLRAGSEHVVDELKRAVEDSLGDIISVLKSGQIVAGAGSIEIELYKRLKDFTAKHSGRIQLALEAFANSMLVIPKTLAENAGLDPIDISTRLNSEHEKGNINFGIDVETGKSCDSYKIGVIEPASLKTQAINSATEVATMILRIDDVIASGTKPKQGGANQMPPEMMQ